ncbi:flagellar biosynthesis protein FlgA [Amycolatopsis sp. EV170708-02-1]|uniref:flagellar biosynthesis protein FlgA n=1 Tax=Amycolatopsis sp. EV170708-02-1 TaxID=2919322 RepID=UPI001F0BA979|nr:flagellar biosynthesis protein FlgA [Amycolatopsis sp. EV170708-02-1]UMP06708.1 flagellar biosynthesis protein FlgA [Amycolatopsis sp. EV170708-02-1]
MLILVGLVLAALCATGTVFVYRNVDTTIAAVGVGAPVRYGQVVLESSVREVQVRPDPGLTPVLWKDRSQLIGRKATTNLWPGSVLTAQAVGGELPPRPGEQLLGIAVKPTQLPATPLEPLKPVLLVPSGQGGTVVETWEPVQGTVVRVGERDQTGLRVVDVVVAEHQGPKLATKGSVGTVAIVLLPGS